MRQNIRQYWEFICSCFKWTYWRWGRGEPILTTIVAWVATVSNIGGFWNQNFLFALIPVGFMLLFVAPFAVWKKTHDELTKITTKRFELSLAPPEKIGGRIRGGEEWFQEWYRIKVHNPTASPISGCYGKLFEFKSPPYPNLPSLGTMFPWSSFSSVGKLTKIAGNDSDYLDIFVFNGAIISMVILDDNTGKRDLGQRYCLIDEYELAIQVGSQDEAFSPSYALIRIKPYVQDYKEHLEVKMLNYNPDCLTRLSEG